VGTRWDWAGYLQPKLILHLRHRARPAPPTRHLWTSAWIYRRGRLSGDEVQLQVWGRKKRMKDDLTRFYQGPVE
jgi:hypothetical protein